MLLMIWDDQTNNMGLHPGLMATHDNETYQYFKTTKVTCVLCPREGGSEDSMLQVGFGPPLMSCSQLWARFPVTLTLPGLLLSPHPRSCWSCLRMLPLQRPRTARVRFKQSDSPCVLSRVTAASHVLLPAFAPFAVLRQEHVHPPPEDHHRGRAAPCSSAPRRTPRRDDEAARGRLCGGPGPV